MIITPTPVTDTVTIRVPAGQSHARDVRNREAHQLAVRIGLTGMQSRMFAGTCTLPRDRDVDGEPRVDAYTTSQHQALDAMASHAGRFESFLGYTIRWEPDTLQVAFDDARGPLARFELTRLEPGQQELAYVLFRRRGPVDVSPEAQALEVPENIALIVAGMRPVETEHDDEDYDPEDPAGLLAFAGDLARSGVLRWPEKERAALAQLARGWTGTASELLTTAHAIQLAPASTRAN